MEELKKLVSEVSYSDPIFILVAATLVIWLLLSLGMAYRLGWLRPAGAIAKVLTILAFLLLGPLYFPFWLLIGAFLDARREEVPYGQAISARWKGQPIVKEEEEDDSFVIIDSDGEGLRQSR